MSDERGIVRGRLVELFGEWVLQVESMEYYLALSTELQTILKNFALHPGANDKRFWLQLENGLITKLAVTTEDTPIFGCFLFHNNLVFSLPSEFMPITSSVPLQLDSR